MIKTKVTETTEKYDKDGNLIERITREEVTEDDESKPILTTNYPLDVTTIPPFRAGGKLNIIF